MSIKVQAPQFWKNKTPLSLLLAPLCPIYLIAQKIDMALKSKSAYQAEVPVISVGNLNVGGSGKTPIVALLAQHFTAQGKTVAILSRGYGGFIKRSKLVSKSEDATEVGDEPKMLYEMKVAAQIWIGPNRVSSVKKAQKAGADIVILDDGFQHVRLKRDVDIVVVNGENGFGNALPFPAGPLRESISALKRANIILAVNGVSEHLKGLKNLPVTRTLSVKDNNKLADAKVIAFCGIGDPEQFFTSVGNTGAILVAKHSFPDHHRLSTQEQAELLKEAKKEEALLVTTAKDAAKLPTSFLEHCHIAQPAFSEESTQSITSAVQEILNKPRKTANKKAKKHLFEYTIARLLLGGLKRLPLHVASSIGCAVGSFYATLPVRSNSVARKNLRIVFPQKKECEIRALHTAAARNIARSFFELPAVYQLSKKEFDHYVSIEGIEYLQNNPGCLILTAHLGSWELILRFFGLYDMPMANIYRKANNAMVDKLITELRTQKNGRQIPKGSKGGRMILKTMQENMHLGILNDQKLNDGIASTFLGQEAMTAPSIAELSLKYNRAVCSVFCLRDNTQPLHFKIIVSPPIEIEKTEDHTADIAAATQKFNDIMSREILENPEQWLWFHGRF